MGKLGDGDLAVVRRSVVVHSVIVRHPAMVGRGGLEGECRTTSLKSQLPEAGIGGVEHQHSSQLHVATAGDQLDRLGGHDRPDHGAYCPDHPAGRAGQHIIVIWWNGV